MTTKSRQWISQGELDRVKTAIYAALGSKKSTLVPFTTLLPLLDKQEVTRLIWCRQARQAFSRWGLKFGIRNKKQAYTVEVLDAGLWRAALAGLTPSEVVKRDEHSEDLHSQETSSLDHLIPTRDPAYLLPDWSEHLRICLQHGSKTLLSGPAGSGKTSIVRQMAALDRKPFIRINLNGESCVGDLLGGWRVQSREMVYRDGPVSMAVRHGAWLCLDELDAAAPSVLFALQGLLEEGGCLHIPDTNEWINPHPHFRLVATANTVGKGDDSGLYAGTQPLNEAFMDRFPCVFIVNYLPAHQEREIIMRKVEGIEARVVDRMIQVAGELRNALSEGLVYCSFSTRKLLAWAAKAIQLGSPQIAARYVVLNKITADDQRVVAEVLQRHGFGGAQ